VVVEFRLADVMLLTGALTLAELDTVDWVARLLSELDTVDWVARLLSVDRVEPPTATVEVVVVFKLADIVEIVVEFRLADMLPLAGAMTLAELDTVVWLAGLLAVERVEPPTTTAEVVIAAADEVEVVVEFRLADTLPLTGALTLAELDWLTRLLSIEEIDEEPTVDVAVALTEAERMELDEDPVPTATELLLEKPKLAPVLVVATTEDDKGAVPETLVEFAEFAKPELALVVTGETTEELPLAVMLADT
ncbi:hypothetical protein LTR36_010260, partial [Oleoguttula mirabilis]